MGRPPVGRSAITIAPSLGERTGGPPGEHNNKETLGGLF